MRRPIKPFVTEYRGNSRRQGSGPGLKPDLFVPETMSRSPAEAPARQMSDYSLPPDDSYEAALRAADALFSGGRSAPAPDEGPSPSLEGAAAREGQHPAGGRILRAIDEPVAPELARLEAEFAPKRRGRKPGSKNKPKVPPTVVAALEEVPMPAPTPAPALAAMPIASSNVPAIVAVPAPASRAKVASSSLHSPPVRSPSVPAAASTASPSVGAAGATRGDRYAWVRTRLKPGEQWKRRLPKVAW